MTLRFKVLKVVAMKLTVCSLVDQLLVFLRGISIFSIVPYKTLAMIYQKVQCYIPKYINFVVAVKNGFRVWYTAVASILNSHT
jgi:hypothetical protein